MKPITSTCIRYFLLMSGLLLLAGAANLEAATFTTVAGASGNWSDGTKWAGGVPASGAGNIALLGAGGSTFTNDVPTIMGVINDGQGSSRAWTINASGTIAMTMDNTGNTANNSAGTLNAYIGESSSGPMTFNPNIIIQNTDLDFANTGSTSPTLTIGILGTSTITATSARNLFIRQNQATSTKAININSSIGGSGSSVITIQNVGTGGGVSTMNLNGVVEPNASVVQNSANSSLSLNNVANNYTGSTTITLGTLRLGAVNAIPSSSSVDITGTLNLVTFSDTIGALTGAGTVNATGGTPTLTVGGGNASGTFSGIIQNTGGTLSVAKTGSGTEIFSGANTYTGTTTINGGFLNAGVADSGSGPFGSGGSIAFGGGTLQYSGANQNDYSSRFSTAANNQISIDTAGQAVTFATALTSSGGSLKLTNSAGSGTLTLTAAETYDGNTTINGGTLVLSGSGALAGSSTITIGAGGTFDVSALASPYTLGGGASLKAGGTGTTVGTTAANIVGAAAGTFDLGSQPVSLTWGGGSSGTDNTHPSLLVSQGTLNLNGNTITVVVPGTALTPGVYTLISAPAITGTPNSIPSYTGGNGVAVGNAGAVSVSGSTVILTVTVSAGVVGTWAVDLDGNWSDGSKWSGGVPHAAKDTAIFGTGSALRTVTLDVNESVGLLTMNNINSFVIANGGNTLTLDNTLSGASVSVTGGTANSIQTAVSLNDNTVVTVGSGKSLAFSGIVSNTAASKTLTFNGTGTNILSGANSYGPAAGSVGTTLNAGGTLQVGNNSALGAGDLSLSGNSTLQAGAAVSISNNIAIADATTVDNNGHDLTLSGGISGAGGVTKTGNGTLTLNGNNTYAGNTTVNNGVLSISSPNNVLNSLNIILNGGDLLGSATFTAANNIGIGAASGGVGTNALIDAVSGQVVTLSGVIGTAGNGGTDGLIVNSGAGNNGTLVLGGANTFNGTTVIANGALQLANTLALQSSGLNYNTGTLLFDGSISAATLGGLSCANGLQNIGLTNTAGGPVALTVGGNNVSTIYGGNLSDGGLGGSFIKTGTGSMTLSNINYTGGTTINAGSSGVTITGGNFGSSSSPITVGSQLFFLGGTATASTFNLATGGGQTGVGTTVGGTANLTNNATTIGSSGNTAGNMTVNTAGNVNLGNVKINKDAGNITVASTGSGLIINGGNVIATSMNIGQSGTGARGADLNINGGSLTISDASQTGMFAIHSGAGSGFLTMSGGALTYLGTDGLLMSVGVGISAASITGGTATLTGVTLNSGGAATNSTLTVGGTNNPSLYLGSVGLVINSPSPTVSATFGTATIGALADWTSAAPITLASNIVFKAADAGNVPHSIALSGVVSGAGGFTKTGAGTLTLSGANIYTGNTVVSNGVLALGSAQGVAGSPNITVVGGSTLDVSATSFVVGGSQTLQGSGTNNGSVSTTSGSKIYAGTDGTYGTNTFNNNLTFAAGAGAYLDVGTVFNGSNDLVTVGGNLALNGNSLHLKAPDAAANLDTTTDYILFSVAGTISGSFLSTPAWDVAPANASRFAIVTDQVNKRVLLHAYAEGVIPPTGIGSASPSTVYGLQTTLISVTVTPGTSPTITNVVLETSSYGGAGPVNLVLSGTPNVYTNTVTMPGTPVTGNQTLTVTITDATGAQGVAAFTLNVQAGRYWVGGAGDDDWSSGLNWLGGTPPSASGDSVTFAGVTRLTPNMEAAYSVAGLTFDSTAGSFTLGSATSSTLTLTGTANNNSPNAQTLNMAVDLAGVPTINTASNNLTINSIVSGGGFIKAGASTLTLTNANTLSGGITLNANAGTLALLGDFSGGGGGQISVASNSTVLLGTANAAANNTLNLRGGSTLKLRADADTSFAVGSPITASVTNRAINFDVNSLTAGPVNKTLSLTEALAFSTNADQTINVTGHSTYALSLGDITLSSGSHAPYFSLNINTLPNGPMVTIASVTAGDWGNDLNLNGGGKVTIAGNLSNTSNGEMNLFVNNGTTATLEGQTVKLNVGDGYKYDVVNGTLVLNDINNTGNSLINNTTGAGVTQSVFILGAATNVISGSGYTHAPGVLTATNNSYNATVYLGAANSGGGQFVNATVTNNVSDGGVGFTNSGTFTIGGQNTSGVNTYQNPIILGWTANRGKSVTLVAATGGQVDFTGGIFRNGTDSTAGVAIGNGAGFAGLVSFQAANTYAGATTISNGTLALSGAGSIANSTTINVGAGATFDVTGIGGFTLGAAQTLKGNGTVNGDLTTLAGSTVAPGASVGTLNVSGNVNLGGTLALELNRTNTPFHYDRLIATGTITYGGPLTVTNIGPALQANDTFQLFSAGVSGFTTVNIATNDANMRYTWQNDLATLGSIKVLTVVPIVNTNAATVNFTATTVGNSLQFSWAPDHLGWQLYTNAVGLTATNSWFPVPGSAAVTNETITINPANPNVFFQLRYP